MCGPPGATWASTLAQVQGCGVVVGHSLGANIALEMAASGQFIGPVVLLAPSLSRADESLFPRLLDRVGRVFGRVPFSLALKIIGPAMKGSSRRTPRRARRRAAQERPGADAETPSLLPELSRPSQLGSPAAWPNRVLPSGSPTARRTTWASPPTKPQCHCHGDDDNRAGTRPLHRQPRPAPGRPTCPACARRDVIATANARTVDTHPVVRPARSRSPASAFAGKVKPTDDRQRLAWNSIEMHAPGHTLEVAFGNRDHGIGLEAIRVADRIR